MSTRTYIEIKATITGDVEDDYENLRHAPDIIKCELQLVCAKYNLNLEWEEIY